MQQLSPVGLIGVGMMGHGIAKNVLKHGFSLNYLEHPGNQPVDDLLALGAGPRHSAAALAAECKVILLCVTGSPEVRAVMLGPDGVMAGLAPGKTVVDCSTVEPHVTTEIAAAVAGTSAGFLDAPLTRTPREAEAGRLNVMVGGDSDTLAAVRPLLDSFAEQVFHAGPVGAGHTLKLLHNFVSLGNCALLAEAVIAARRGSVDITTFVEVLASGGGGSVALERLRPYILESDEGGFRFSLANCLKDMSYYTSMTDHLGAGATVANAVRQVFALAETSGAGQAPVPHLIDVLEDSDRG